MPRFQSEVFLDRYAEHAPEVVRMGIDVTPQREKFEQLVQIGLQAALPVGGGQFMVRGDAAGMQDMYPGTVDIIVNTPYAEMPELQKKILTGISTALMRYLVNVVEIKPLIDEKAYQVGREVVSDGYMNGAYGKASGMYDLQDPDDRRRYKSYSWIHTGTDVHNPHYRGPDSTEKQRTTYENIVDLGFLSLQKRQIFPYLYMMEELTYHDNEYIDGEQGISEGALRGMAAARRVQRVTADRPELQAPVLKWLQPRNQ